MQLMLSRSWRPEQEVTSALEPVRGAVRYTEVCRYVGLRVSEQLMAITLNCCLLVLQCQYNLRPLEVARGPAAAQIQFAWSSA